MFGFGGGGKKGGPPCDDGTRFITSCTSPYGYGRGKPNSFLTGQLESNLKTRNRKNS